MFSVREQLVVIKRNLKAHSIMYKTIERVLVDEKVLKG